MTKKDFELVAGIIHNYPSHAPSLRTARASFASSFADAFEKENPRFNRAKFLKASIGYDPAKEHAPSV